MNRSFLQGVLAGVPSLRQTLATIAFWVARAIGRPIAIKTAKMESDGVRDA
jgi:hypothetical protein